MMTIAKIKKSVAKRSRRRPRVRPRSTAPTVDPVEAAVAALAHEVRTPLTGILALSELLAASDLPERERRWAAAVKSAADHLAQLTTLVVDGVKATGRKPAPTRQHFRPRELAEAVAAMLSARAEAKGLDAEIAISEALPALVGGEPVWLRAALENLVDNAIKFTERGTVRLVCTCKPEGRGRLRLVFAVHDSGIGLTRAEIKRLFRPFAQASDDVATRFGGAGLGLVFVKRLAKAVGGDVAVESTPGRGTTFRLGVVVERLASKADPRSRSPGHGRERGAEPGLRVLCVEDNPYGRVILNTILTELGHHVDFVGTGEGAVELVAAGGHDLVLMDITLPGIDGIEATQRVRALAGPAARIPIIGISGHAAAGDEARARAAGMNSYLAKPVSPSALAAVIASQVGRLDQRV